MGFMIINTAQGVPNQSQGSIIDPSGVRVQANIVGTINVNGIIFSFFFWTLYYSLKKEVNQGSEILHGHSQKNQNFNSQKNFPHYALFGRTKRVDDA